MSHKTLIGGTAYNITGGKTLVGGTAYSISKGRTQVGGTDYDISFSPTPYAMLYTDGNMVFQYGSSVESGKTLRKSYSGFEDVEYSSSSSIPWDSNRNNIKNVSFKDIIRPFSISHWFHSSINLTTFNYSNLDLNYITNMAYTYRDCYNLTGNPVCGNNVTNMYWTYSNCYNLTGNPACGEKVTNMAYTYRDCYNLTGTPVCGDNVTNMSMAYCNCYNLTGNPVCGENVTSMGMAYENCYNLTGNPVCGNNVTTMYSTYRDCYNLTGNPVCGNKVTDMYWTYCNCYNLYGNAYFYSNNVSGARNCFYGRNTSNRLNIYVHNGSKTMNTLLINNIFSLVGANMTWTNNGSCYYNRIQNIYIYPVANVFAAENSPPLDADLLAKLVDFEYNDNFDGTVTLTDWKDTLNGVSSTRMVIPDDNRIKLV